MGVMVSPELSKAQMKWRDYVRVVIRLRHN